MLFLLYFFYLIFQVLVYSVIACGWVVWQILKATFLLCMWALNLLIDVITERQHIGIRDRWNSGHDSGL